MALEGGCHGWQELMAANSNKQQLMQGRRRTIVLADACGANLVVVMMQMAYAGGSIGGGDG